ncbi:MAG: virulence-associated V antigen, partial [Planctomycetota bacterium]|nr:virulence-associated V antigen [Planctomycetota bacterium]
DLNLYLQLNDGKHNGNLGGTYQWGDVNTGQSTFDNFNTEVKSAISNLTNVSQQQTTVFSNLTSSYSNGVSTLTQMLSKLTSTKQTILQKW